MRVVQKRDNADNRAQVRRQGHAEEALAPEPGDEQVATKERDP